MSEKPVQKTKPAPPAHPLYKDMIIAAIAELKDRKGASRQAIVKYIIANYKVGDNAGKLVTSQLKKGVESGIFVVPKDSRARFKLSEAAKTAAKKPAKKPVKKPVAKKPAAKTAKPKKPAAKTTTKRSPKTKKKPAKSPAKKPKSPAKAKKPAAKSASKKAGKKASPKKGVKKPSAKKAPRAKK